MKIARSLTTFALLFMCAPLLVYGQGTKASDAPENAKAEPSTPVKLLIVLSEYDGTKKIANLPYTMPLIVGDKPSGAYSTLRIGVKVPVKTGESKTGDTQIQYIDVGTSIDARVSHADGGKYQVDLKVDRSSLYVAARGQDGKVFGKEWSGGEAPPTTEPIVRQYRGDVGMSLREGQTSEGTVATDPLTGHIFKVEVTLNMAK
ncbi:MAG: hypothetical protein ABSC10_08230 [Candidatus Acidiferrales bacterium]|jgi:hypothetical protein